MFELQHQSFEARGAGAKPRGMTAPGGGATRARNSFAMSIIGTQCTSACVLTHSMKRSWGRGNGVADMQARGLAVGTRGRRWEDQALSRVGWGSKRRRW